MEHPDSDDTADKNVDTGADNLDASTRRPSAIERQLAAASRNYGYQIQQEAADGEIRQRYYYAKHRRRRRVGLVSLLALFLFVALGAAFVFTQFGWPPRNDASVFQLGGQTQFGGQRAVIPSRPPASAHPVAPKAAPDVATPDAIAVPIADVSLWDRPELLAQLVQVYRSQLADNPTDSVALAALNRLREQSLSQLETIMLGKPDATSFKSLQLVSRLFPELIDNPRFTSLIARSGQIQRKTEAEISTEPPIEPKQSTPATPVISSAPVSPPAEASTEIAKKPAATAVSTKPQIRVLSVTPGTMIEQRFVPSNEGKAFMVEISYRNFINSDDQSEITLVALLGTPGDAEALAEVPVDIAGDRGTKSFLMETLVSGSAGEKYRLNFLLNGEFLASSTVRLSAPEQ